MKFNVLKLEEKLQKALVELEKYYDFKLSDDGIVIEYEKLEGKEVYARLEDGNLKIGSSKYAGFFKAFSEYLYSRKNYSTTYSFEKLGMMIDNSRNGVTNVDFTKQIIAKTAFMGHNTIYLYIEDTYLVEEEPYFGYLRGAYSKKELKEIDDYADIFGMEVVPCIQTLAHINQFFMWEHIASAYADIDDILCVGEPKVLKLIDNMIKTFATTLRSKRIHLGMDEAYNLGRGRYADLNGLKEKPYIMLEHLNNMLSICNKYELSPIIWDDMFFTNYSKLQEKDKNFYIPDGIGLMYWDYYNSKEEHYVERIKMRKSISKDVLFAGGAWRWVGYTPHHSKTLKTLDASMKACVEENISEVLITTWSDDSTECPFYNLYIGALKASENNYKNNEIEDKCKFYTGIEYDDFMLLENLDLVQNTDIDQTPSKYWFYEDILMSKFMYHSLLVKEDMNRYYIDLSNKYFTISNKYSDLGIKELFAMYGHYAKVLANKWNITVRIYNNYQNSDKLKLQDDIKIIDDIVNDVELFAKYRKKVWYRECKRYGFEILDQRFGGLIQRLKSAKDDLLNYINNDIKIEELIEKRLPYSPEFEGKDFVYFNRAQRIMSASRMTW